MEPSLWWVLALWLVIGVALLIMLIGAISMARDFLDDRQPEPKRTEIRTRLQRLQEGSRPCWPGSRVE